MQMLNTTERSQSPKLLTVLLLSAMLCMASCATIFTGTKQNVSFTSMPSGANVQVNGIDRGTTPVTVKLKKAQTGQTVSVSSSGYETRTFQPETNFNAVTLANILFIPCLGIDYLTGAMWKYHPKQYNVELTKKR